MKTELHDGTLTLFPEGHVDSKNAADFERDAMAAVEAAPGTSVVVDVDKLEYVSSAGLRVFMKLARRAKGTLSVVNASPEVYDIFDVTGFVELMDVRKRLRTVSVEGLELLGSGANGSVYRFTRDEMIKAFRPGLSLDVVEAEREASRTAFMLGVPCAIPFDTVRCGEGYGTVYEMLNAATITERVRERPESLERYAHKAADLLRQLHKLEVPADAMQPGSAPYYNTIEANANKFTKEEVAQMRGLYDAIPPMNRFVHNDFHTRNIMESDGELMLIDLGESGAGNPLLDLVHSCLVFNLIGTGGGVTQPDDAISFVGLTYGELRRFWNVMLAEYCGSAEQAARLTELLMPYARLTYLASSMAHPLLPKELHPVYVDAIRTEVLTHVDEMLASVDEMLALLPVG
jgi:uncharacterized protein (TIGR02172 family)